MSESTQLIEVLQLLVEATNPTNTPVETAKERRRKLFFEKRKQLRKDAAGKKDASHVAKRYILSILS